MESNEVQVSQVIYEKFDKYSGIEMATMTEWSNEEGIDVYIQREHNSDDINISLTHSDIVLLRQMFLDFEIN